MMLLAGAVSLFVSGCRENLYSGLSEADANEMVFVLLNRGIDAKKVSQGKTGFAVTVEEEHFVRSLEIIKEHSLPREKFQSLGTVFSGSGMISSQLEEQSRLAYAISQELSGTFSRIDGVLDARVHVVLMHNEQGTGLTTPPSASVFIRHVADSPVVDMVSGIRETAAKAVPGLAISNVSVVLEPFKENIIIAPAKTAGSSEEKAFWCIVTAAGSVLLTSGIFLLTAFLKRRKALKSAPETGESGQKEAGA
jgi:type III secretion protein J